ncbi:DUF4102 domain-containing protein [Alteriqipengyuania lutimaris]|uniref:DUF4102 domain-containing protein n=2 Tax=Alteriqipengyuania lutimaris TaxID=1538146 RepID=A0A395LGW5_9SPHN|nr:DUF4102 domain-containing protein [Alteriqipengyuania lutimaris]
MPDPVREKRLFDGGGLYLAIRPSGAKSWKLKYRWHGAEKKLTIGPYPAVSLREAREKRDEAKAQISAGTDPGAAKRARLRKVAVGETFEEVARTWHAGKKAKLTDRYAGELLRRLEVNAFPLLGRKQIAAITPADVLEAIRRIEKRGSFVMAQEVRATMSEVFVWAIASGLAETDPAAIIRKALQPSVSGRFPAVETVEEARDLLNAIDKRNGNRGLVQTKLASRLLALTAVRPGVVRIAERDEFEQLEGSEPFWRIPAAKMKLLAARKSDSRFDFIVPLAPAAAAAVSAAMEKSAHQSFLFPGANRDAPISDSTLSQLYLDAGYRGRHVPHGWRAAFSTIMNERAAVQERWGDREIIDLMLAHVKGDVEAAYNRAAYMPRRRQLAEEWAQLLDVGLKDPHALS